MAFILSACNHNINFTIDWIASLTVEIEIAMFAQFGNRSEAGNMKD
jgi:hypothetical protein